MQVELLTAELNYSNIECEFLGLLLAVTHFKYFTYSRLVHIITDHKPLVSLSWKTKWKINQNISPTVGFYSRF